MPSNDQSLKILSCEELLIQSQHIADVAVRGTAPILYPIRGNAFMCESWLHSDVQGLVSAARVEAAPGM